MAAFADIPVSTQTFTVRSNIQHIELSKFYNELQPKNPDDIDNQGVAILCVKYQQQKKGLDQQKDLKIRRKRNNSTKREETPKRNFLNCITLIIQVEKRINIKIFKNGVFQLTGCKHINNVKDCLRLILTKLFESNEKMLKTETACFQFEQGYNDFIIYIKSAMRNIDFDLGFRINRTQLSKTLAWIYSDNDDVIIPDATGNKMDVKIKIRITREELEALPVTKITNLAYDLKEEVILYKDCLHIEADKKKIEAKLKDKFVSISIFQNGKILLSTIDASIQAKYYDWLIELINQIRDDIKQPILPKKTFLIGSMKKTKHFL